MLSVVNAPTPLEPKVFAPKLRRHQRNHPVPNALAASQPSGRLPLTPSTLHSASGAAAPPDAVRCRAAAGCVAATCCCATLTGSIAGPARLPLGALNPAEPPKPPAAARSAATSASAAAALSACRQHGQHQRSGDARSLGHSYAYSIHLCACSWCAVREGVRQQKQIARFTVGHAL